MENDWKDYFVFTKKERIGIIVLLLLIFTGMLLPRFFEDVTVRSAVSLEGYEQQLAKAMATDSVYKEVEPVVYDAPRKAVMAELFYFDPNTIDIAGWRRLGLRERTIHTIQNYLSKGGRFRKPQDVGAIYGLKKEEFNRLLPYIRIKEMAATAPAYTARESGYKRPAIAVIDINKADTTAFIDLPGIGSKLAARIINFRDKLGGFYSVAQVAETYGLADSVFQQVKEYLRCTSPAIRTININTADAATLRLHPYIKWPLANAIVQYRQQHGHYATVEEIKQIALVTPEMFDKIVVYLSVN